MSRTFVVILIGRVLQVLLSFLTIKVVTNYLSKENVAYYFLILTVLNYFGLTLISPVGQFVNRKTHEWFDQKILLNRLFNHNFCGYERRHQPADLGAYALVLKFNKGHL